MGSDGECKATPKTSTLGKDRSPLAEVSGCTDVLQIAVHVAETDVIGGAREILAKLRPSWSSENIQFKLFTDGITNKLVGCYHRPTTSNNNVPTSNGVSHDDANNATDTATATNATLPASANDVVLIRIYGNKTDLLIDRQTETRNIKMLQRHGFAPNLYAVFQNGLAYEYVPGVTLTPQSVCSARVWPLVARHMAKMHRLAVRGSGAASETTPMLGPKMRSFLDLVPERFSDEAKETRLRALGLPPLQQLRADFESLYARLRALDSPVVFSHNDLLLGNVIYEEAADRVAFIDYEYAAHNYQAFDIGNHFTEFAGIDEIDYARYPSREFQDAWLRVYLDAFGVQPVTAEAVQRLYGQVNAFALASHYFWTVWGLIQTEHSTIDFDFVLFAMTRYNEYLARRDEFLALSE